MNQGYFDNRPQAQKAILAGYVRVGKDHVIQKSSEVWDNDTSFIVKSIDFVSRGAKKLLPFLGKYASSKKDYIAMDIGASTGGFTDVLLQHGSKKVYAIDVGYGQLHYRLRKNSRVISLERTNARYLTTEHIPQLVSIVTVDVSFISVTKILPNLTIFLQPDAFIFVLLKPQFEAKRAEIGKGGIVRSSEVRDRIAHEIPSLICSRLGWQHIGTHLSPIKGTKGNIEFMAIFKNQCILQAPTSGFDFSR